MAGSVTFTSNDVRVGNDVVQELIWAWIGDSSDGGVPDTVSDITVTGYIMFGKTDPDSPAPTDNYDIALNDADDTDVFGGELANRDTANTEHAIPKIGNAYGDRFVNSVLTMALSGNSVNSAEGELKVYVRKPSP